MSTADLAGDVSRAADALRRVTVEIRTNRRGLGAGVVWREPRAIVTNAHVVGTHQTCVVHFANGRTKEGRVVRKDEHRDLALIEVAPVGAGPPPRPPPNPPPMRKRGCSSAACGSRC